MSTKLLTGYAGEKNITPDDDAQLYNALLGGSGGDYILPVGGRMAASEESVNEVSVADGVMSIQGRIVRHYADTYAVDTCATGFNRKDIIALRYTKDEDGTESADVFVIKGEEVEGEAKAPELTEASIGEGASVADMGLYLINLSGSDISLSQLAPVWDGFATIGKYYTASGESDIYDGTYGTICTLTTQEAGVYLLIGNVIISKSLDGTQVSRFANVTNGEALLPLRFSRTPFTSGGGVTIFGLVRFNAGGGTVDVQSYGKNGASPWSATACAIKIAN